MLGQTATPQNIPLQQMLANTVQMFSHLGVALAQAQALAMGMLQQYIALSAATMGFDDVFRVAAAITLLAMMPAAFLKTSKRAAPGGGAPMMD